MKEEAQKIQDYLEITCSADPNEIIDRISTITVYLARTAQMLADAKKIVADIKKKGIAKEVIALLTNGVPLSATAQKAVIDGIAIEEQYMVNWIERINRTCTHQIDALRSMLSYEKELLSLSKRGY